LRAEAEFVEESADAGMEKEGSKSRPIFKEEANTEADKLTRSLVITIHLCRMGSSMKFEEVRKVGQNFCPEVSRSFGKVDFVT
jgi:hypothetical protein